MRLKHYLSCMLILLSFVTVNAQKGIKLPRLNIWI